MATGGSHHQPIASQLAAPVPGIHRNGGTTKPSRRSLRLPPIYLLEWDNFESQTIEFMRGLKDPIRNAVSGTIEDFTVPRIDVPQYYLVDKEHSIKGKISNLIVGPSNSIVIAAKEPPDASMDFTSLCFGGFKYLSEEGRSSPSDKPKTCGYC